jgi:hypothetical protein
MIGWAFHFSDTQQLLLRPRKKKSEEHASFLSEIFPQHTDHMQNGTSSEVATPWCQ